jgi:hypothetical protein
VHAQAAYYQEQAERKLRRAVSMFKKCSQLMNDNPEMEFDLTAGFIKTFQDTRRLYRYVGDLEERIAAACARE